MVLAYMSRWLPALTELEQQLSAEDMPQETRAKLDATFRQLLREMEDSVDVRDFCEGYFQSMCITDGEGRILYMNPR